jgi:hypothetical protein
MRMFVLGFPVLPLRVVAALVAGLGLVGIAGCGAAPAAAPPAPAGAAVSSSSSLPPPGEVVVTGAVRHPGIRLNLAQLTAMPTHTVTVSFSSAKGTESHTETGVPVATLLGQLGLATDPARKDDELSFAVFAIGADGYRAVVSYGEISPEYGNRDVLVSLVQDGTPLARPRLIVPGDVKGGRDVANLVRLQITRVVPH